jgi:zinc protease
MLAVEPPQNGERRVTVTKQAQLPIVYLAWHVPNQKSDDAAALELLSTILAGGRASRLYRDLVYQRQLALEAGGDYSYFSIDPNLFWFWATPMPGQTPEKLEAELIAHMERLKTEPLPTRSWRAQESDGGGLRLSGRLDPPARLDAGALRADRRVRAQGVVCGEDSGGHGRRPHAGGAHLVRARQEERRRPAAEVVMTRYLSTLGAAMLASGLAWAPAGAAPIAHREVLPNGIVLLVAERPAVPIVAVRVYMRAGSIYDPPDQAGLANLTGAVLTRGTAKRTGPELDSAIEFVGASLQAGASRDGLSVSLTAQKKDMTLGLDLLSEVVLTPAFPEAEVTRKVAEIQAAIKRSEEDPNTVAARALSRLIFQGHPYGLPIEGTRETVGRLTRDGVVKFYRERARPDATIVAVVGAVTVDEARREVMARLGSWARPTTPAPSAPTATSAGAGREETITRELSQATIMFGRQAIGQTDPEYFPLAVASYVLGGGSASRLYTRVREESGLAYSVYSWVSPWRHGASFAVSAQTRTVEVPKVVGMIREELARMAREPVADRELALAKQYLIGSFPLRLDTSGKVADFLVAIEERGVGLDYADRYKERIGKVTAADVQRVAAKFLPAAKLRPGHRRRREVSGLALTALLALLLAPPPLARAASFTLEPQQRSDALRVGAQSATREGPVRRRVAGGRTRPATRSRSSRRSTDSCWPRATRRSRTSA